MNSKFDFMAERFPELASIGKRAEECLYYDYNLCLLNLGRLAETIIDSICRHYNIQDKNLNELSQRKIISDETSCKLKNLLEIKHDASDKDYNSPMACRRLMDTACDLCKWFLDRYGRSNFDFLEDLFHPSDKSFPLRIISEAGRDAEKNLYSNSRYCLICIGDIEEIVLDIIFTRLHLEQPENTLDKIKLLYEQKYLDRKNSDVLHDIRMTRNKAVHSRYSSESDCKKLLGDIMPLCEWVFSASLSPGDIIRGVITSINNDGLTISIGRQLTGIVQTSELTEHERSSYDYIEGRKDIFKIIRISPDDGKIYLGINDSHNNPWAKSSIPAKINSIVKLSKSDFLKLCRTGSNYEIIKAVNEGADVKYSDSNGFSVLMCVIERGLSPELVKLMLERGSNVNSADNKGNTALIIAAKNCGEEIIMLLLDNKADKNALNNNGKNAYSYARGNAKLKNSQVINLLKPEGTKDSSRKKKSIIAKKKIHTDKDNKAKDSISISEKTPAAVKEVKPEIKTVPKYDYEAVKLICKYKSSDELTQAVNSGAIIDFSHLIAACENNTSDVIKILLEKLQGKTLIDKDGNTPLMIALDKDNNNPGVIETLIDSASDLNAKNNSGRTALIIACDKNNLEAVKLLLERKVNANIQDNKSNTALMIAAGKNYQDIALLLIQYGADINIKNNNGNTALDVAMKRMKGSEAVKMMLRKKFFALCKSGSPDKIRQAIEAGISVNLRSTLGNTALMYAACSNSPEVVNILLDSGADPRIKNSEGAYAIDFAKKNQKLAGTEALRRLESSQS
ncbi:MAG: ankyrin repeat domain-containing protein [Synergistaceae bacterium]|nr:ankyrin repeat domain-containing protein [Synergistaceae bacterium]